MDSICRLVEMGIKINSLDFHNKSPLHYAARMGDIEIGNLLVKLGAELNLLDFKGRTPAGLAEDKEHFEFADTLERLGGKRIKSYEVVNDNQCEKIEINSIEKINDKLFMDLKDADKRFKKIYKQ